MANTFNHNDKVVITDGGSVGIGTTSPSSKLHIAGSDGSWDRHLTLEYDASNVVKIVGDTDGLKLRTMNSGKGFYFRNSANSTNLIITDGGNVGIGTTSPAQRFHVNSGTDNIAALFQSTDQSVSILFDDSLKVTEINSNNGQFIFSVNGTSGGTTATEAMRINRDGNVGIGTGSPSYTLDVSGTQRVTGNVVFEGQISFPGVNGNNFVVDTDAQRIVWEHQRNGTRKMTFYHETDADTFNFSFASGNNLQINGNRIVTANELGTAAASAATDFVAVSGDTMSGDLNMGSNDIKAVNSIVLNNVEGSSFGTVNGTLIFDENFYGDTEYGTAWAGGNGGGLAIYGEDGWNRMLSDKNAQWFLGTAAFSRSDDFVAVTGDTMSGNLTISNSSPDLFFETGATHYNWMVAAQENVNAGFEISVGSQDADSSNDTWSPKLVILQSGNVGIGTTSPSYKLHVEGGGALIKSNVNDGSAILTIRSSDNYGYSFARSNATGFLEFDGNQSGYVGYVFKNGNVGIGTTSPSYTLDVVGDFRARDNSNQLVFAEHGTSAIAELKIIADTAHDAALYFGDTLDNVRAGFYYDVSANQLQFRGYNNGTRMVISSNGNVGIGTTSPQTKLEVDGSTNSFVAHFGQGQDNGDGSWGGISVGYGETSNSLYRKVGIVAEAHGDGAARQHLHFLVDTVSDANSATLSDSKMMIDGFSGNVGIGTTTPGSKLTTIGTIQTSRTSAESENLLFYSQQTAKWGSSTYPGVIESYGNNSMIIGSGQNVPIYIARSGAIALTIGTGGNVGIGTTSPGYKLDVSGDIRATETVISGGQQLVIPAVGRFLFDSSTDYNTATEGSIAISTEGAIQGGDNTVYTINERDITFNESGFYKISVYITYTSTTQRANPGIRLKKNNTDYISPWGLSGYLRYASGHNEASNFVDTIAYFDEGDYVEVYTKAFAASGTCTDDGSGSHILIERIAM